MPNDYGGAHQKLRATWAQRIANHTHPPCARCGNPIYPTDKWHLDHTDDGLTYLGPSHQYCNTSAAGRKSQRQRHPHTPTPQPQSQAW